MLRSDGDYTIYMIQHQEKSGRWVYSSFDHFGTPPGFSASGDCWQRTGEHGVFTEEEGIRGLQWMVDRKRTIRCSWGEEKRYCPGAEHSFRLVRVTITQRTEAVMTRHKRGRHAALSHV